MGILGNATLMLHEKASTDPEYAKLKAIEKYVLDGSRLTQQLLGVAKGGKYEVRPADINELIKKNSLMFGRTRKEIRIHRKFQKNVWTVMIDHGQIEQVLLNLYVNAWQAMPAGGDLYLQTANVTQDEDSVRGIALKPGNYVRISVTDSGGGMNEETRLRVFDPFFTTKKMGRGTGLGLASAYGIIKNHGGAITVYSQVDKGTTFNIYLPASNMKVVPEKKQFQATLTGSGTVLLVDDEQMILDVGREMLEKLGYYVLTADGGNAALEVYQQNRKRIDAVILDMIMPDMGGGDVYQRLKTLNPDIRVMLSSGYSINGMATDILNQGCNGFIQKPFNLRDLSIKMKEILNQD
jgi:two-component system, cell cycle sensor histidine kinase and response regulator CckA